MYLQNKHIFNISIQSSSGFVTIELITPEPNDSLSIFRYVSKFSDGVGVQDEIHINNENQSAQFNFEQDINGQLIKFPQSDVMGEGGQRVVKTFREGVKIVGAKLNCRKKLRYISDGEKWIPIEEYNQSLTAGNPQLS